MKELVLSVVITWVFINMLKPIVTWIRTGEINRRTLATNGGMPSGHTALVAPLTTALFLETGFSMLFVLSLALTLNVIYDAISIRMIIERQSRTINALTEGKPGFAKMEENVGHEPAEVFVSLVLSVIVPLIVYRIF